MRDLFYPKSVVVFGVSDSSTNMGRKIVDNLDKFKFSGPVYLVGRDGGSLNGRKIYKNVEDIDDIPGLAVFLIPARFIPDALDACGKKGIRYAVIESSGFTEYGEEGYDFAKKLKDVADKWNIRFVGPNGVGITNIENGLVLPFVSIDPAMAKKGHVSLIAQSGGIVVDSIFSCALENIGFSKMVSMGNKMNLNENDYVEYLISDPETHTIGMHLEDIINGRRLMDLACRTDKPIVVLKANTNSSSNQIANFHTAALAGDDQVAEAAFTQAGLIRVKSFQEMMDCFKILSLPPIRGQKLGIVCRSGGRAVMATDSVFRYGFELAEYSEMFYDFVKEKVRAGVIRMTNPIDLGDVWDVDAYIDIIDKAIQENGVDGLIVHHNFLISIDLSRKCIEAARRISFEHKKPVIFSTLFSREDWISIRQMVEYPIFADAEQALNALRLSYNFSHRMIRRTDFEKYEHAQKIFPGNQLRFLEHGQAFDLLRSYNIPVAHYKIVSTADEGVKAAQEMEYPIVLKVAKPHILHKTEEKGVKLNIGSDDELLNSFQEMKGDAFLIQKMVPSGQEVIIGGKRDPGFGPVILFGLGGIFVEVLKDVSLRVAPVDHDEAASMIDEIQGVCLLDGFRGQAPADKEALIEILVNVSKLLAEHPEIENLDINPLVVWESGKGCIAVDAKVEVMS